MDTKTKAEILKDQFADKYKKVVLDGQMVIDILDGMDVYAKQEAIGFANYLVTKQGCVPRTENEIVYWYFMGEEEICKGTTEDLYNLYLTK